MAGFAGFLPPGAAVRAHVLYAGCGAMRFRLWIGESVLVSCRDALVFGFDGFPQGRAASRIAACDLTDELKRAGAAAFAKERFLFG